jgi:hypothetical protein
MVNGIGAHLTNDEKKAHLIDLKRDHLIDQVCVQKILPPAKMNRASCIRTTPSSVPSTS